MGGTNYNCTTILLQCMQNNQKRTETIKSIDCYLCRDGCWILWAWQECISLCAGNSCLCTLSASAFIGSSLHQLDFLFIAACKNVAVVVMFGIYLLSEFVNEADGQWEKSEWSSLMRSCQKCGNIMCIQLSSFKLQWQKYSGLRNNFLTSEEVNLPIQLCV